MSDTQWEFILNTAVEQAARGICATTGGEWATLTDESRQRLLREARAALDAVGYSTLLDEWRNFNANWTTMTTAHRDLLATNAALGTQVDRLAKDNADLRKEMLK